MKQEHHICPIDETGLCDDCPCHSTPTTPIEDSGWEERFDNTLGIELLTIPLSVEQMKNAREKYDMLKSFIRSLLASEKARVVQMVDGMKQSGALYAKKSDYERGYNKALSDLLTKLTNEK